MKKLILSITVMLSIAFSYAQDAEKENLKKNEDAAARKMDEIPDGWKKAGNLIFLFNQSSFNNDWQGGGVSNLSGNLGFNYEINYKKGNVVWDNRLAANYGLTKIKTASKAVKTSDLLDLNSLWGKKAKGNWYYSAFGSLLTQIDEGLDGKGLRISNTFSPAFIKFGPGMFWKKSDNLKVNFAPTTSRFIFVDKEFTKLGTSFGVDQGRTSRFEFGASIAAYYKFNIAENVSVENILDLYSNYLENPQNIDSNYRMNVAMKINKSLSANFSLQTIYDDNATPKVQVSQLFGVGINYGL